MSLFQVQRRRTLWAVTPTLEVRGSSACRRRYTSDPPPRFAGLPQGGDHPLWLVPLREGAAKRRKSVERSISTAFGAQPGEVTWTRWSPSPRGRLKAGGGDLDTVVPLTEGAAESRGRLLPSEVATCDGGCCRRCPSNPPPQLISDHQTARLSPHVQSRQPCSAQTRHISSSLARSCCRARCRRTFRLVLEMPN